MTYIHLRFFIGPEIEEMASGNQDRRKSLKRQFSKAWEMTSDGTLFVFHYLANETVYNVYF